MTALPALAEVVRFRDLIAERLGLQFDESKLGTLATVLHQHAHAQRVNCTHHLLNLAHASGTSEAWYRLAGELTVTETYFLRNSDQFIACRDIALPNRLACRADGETIRILCAGCASGEEPYSLAMVASEHFAYALPRIAITALDVSAAMLDKAARGRYTHWSLRDFPPDMRARWFKPEAESFVLDPAIRAKVQFEQHNLAHDSCDFGAPDSLDIVFCRNVLMYFSPEQAQAVIARITRALAPDGYFFLGHAETLRGLSHDFHLCHTHGTFYYQRKNSITPAQPFAPPPVARWQPAAVLGDTRWVAEIQRASDRILALSVPAPTPAAPTAPQAAAATPPLALAPAPDLHRALEYLQREQYGQALAQLGTLDAAQALDPDVLLLKAVSQSHGGALDAARATCHALLERDELNAGAHYVLALCCEGAADLGAAVEHDRTAAYLDPGFAMPHLHMGLLARRQGNTAHALRDLSQALALLLKEDPSRLLLFAGGFKREALIALCRAELASLGTPA